MTPSKLKTLAGRVEAATGPDRELDAAIKEAVGHSWDYAADWGPRGHDRPTAFAYTDSLDAAMTLATGFVLLHLSDIGADGLPLCKLGDPGTTPAGEWTGIASRLELAVCSAALRARANQGATDDNLSG